MDREVAADWLDRYRPDANFRFRPYLHNCPDRDSETSHSDQTDQLDQASLESESWQTKNMVD